MITKPFQVVLKKSINKGWRKTYKKQLRLYTVVAMDVEYGEVEIPEEVEFTQDEKLVLDEEEKDAIEQKKINETKGAGVYTWLLLAHWKTGEFKWVGAADVRFAGFVS